MSVAWDCACWQHYPNEHHKHKNGKWKCVDKFECIRDLVEERTLSGYDCCTHCVRKDERKWIKIHLGNMPDSSADKTAE